MRPTDAKRWKRRRRSEPDLILLDVVMPHMSGFQVCEERRAQPGTRNIPIIMVTTLGEAKNAECGYRSSSCNDYVTKPIGGSELLAKIRHLLGDYPLTPEETGAKLVTSTSVKCPSVSMQRLRAQN